MRLPVETIHDSLSSLSVATLASVCKTAKNNSVTGRKHREPEAAVEAEDFSRFEGEGGREEPIPDLVDELKPKPGETMKPPPT